MPTTSAAYRRAVRDGEAGGVHRVVLSDLTGQKVDCRILPRAVQPFHVRRASYRDEGSRT
jgi:hypothetical protein